MNVSFRGRRHMFDCVVDVLVDVFVGVLVSVLVGLGGVTQADPQTLADLCARYELEMDAGSVLFAILFTWLTAAPSDAPGARLKEIVTDAIWPECGMLSGPRVRSK